MRPRTFMVFSSSTVKRSSFLLFRISITPMILSSRFEIGLQIVVLQSSILSFSYRRNWSTCQQQCPIEWLPFQPIQPILHDITLCGLWKKYAGYLIAEHDLKRAIFERVYRCLVKTNRSPTSLIKLSLFALFSIFFQLSALRPMFLTFYFSLLRFAE